MNQNFNLHCHTTRCHHAVGRDEQYILAAIDAKMECIGFSEHLAYPGVEIYSDRMLNEDMEEYLTTMNALKEKYKDKIKVMIGFEFEYFEDQKEYLQQIKKRCEYLIVGQHFRYVDGYNYDHFNNDEDILMYAHQIEAALANGLTKYVAHPDYFMLGRRTFNEACKRATNIICDAAIKYDAVLEINLNGLRYGKLLYQEDQYAYPTRDFFTIAANKGCTVCFGYDAHHPVTLLENRRIAICLDLLKGIDLQFVGGYKEIMDR